MHVHLTDGAVMSQAFQSDPQPRFVPAAHEFEGQMIKILLKPMTSNDGLTDDEDAPYSSSGEVLGEFASEVLGKALSERGGFGIAHQIVRQLSRSGNQAAANQVTTNLHADTEVGRRK